MFYTGPYYLFTALTFFLPVFSYFLSLKRGDIDVLFMGVHMSLSLYTLTRLASNSQRSTCLCLPSVGIKDMHHHCLAVFSAF